MSCIMANTIQLITCNKHSQSKTSGNVHIGHPHCLPLDNHSCSKIKLKGERSCVRLYTAKQYKYMHLSSVPRSFFSLKVAAIEDKGHINTSTK